MYPKSVELLINSFLRLPGVGRKTAERYAYNIINNYSDEDINKLIDSLLQIKEINKCSKCGFLAEEDLCEICKDESRNKKIVLVVEEPKDVVAIERTNNFNGLYHILNGVISPLNGIGPDELNIDSLTKRIDEDSVEELIIATSATVEGETTAMYLARLYSTKTKVTRIAYGMPVGSSLEYNDETTIIKALDGRKPII